MSDTTALNALLMVGEEVIPQPFSYSWSLQDVSAPSAGRTEDALMWKETVAKKRKLQLSWKTKSTEDTRKIIKAFSDNEYINVRYFDMLDNAYEWRTFYVGDREADVKIWWTGRHLINTISFDLIER